MTSFITALLTFALLSLPGWIVAMRARANLGVTIAAGVGSLFLVLLSSALIAELVGPLPAWAIYIVALLVAAAAYLGDREAPLHLPAVAPVQLVFPAFCAAVAFAAYSLAFQTGGDPAIFRAWYNADWFKHLGHVNSAANFGFPLEDIFAGRGRLHYYWLFYLLPGAGASLHGDAQGALIATTAITAFTFWLLLHETLKACGLGDRGAALMSFVGWSINAMSMVGVLVANSFDIRRMLDEMVLNTAMLDEINTYIPQHALMLCGLLSFILLFVTSSGMQYRRVLAVAPVLAAGAISTLLGASVVAACCLTIFFLSRSSLPIRIIAATALGSGALAVLFVMQIVDHNLGQEALASPIFADGMASYSMTAQLSEVVVRIVGLMGFFLPLGAIGILRELRSDEERHVRMATVATLMIIVGLGASCLAIVATEGSRLAGEIALRNKLLIVIGLLIGVALLVSRPLKASRHRHAVVALVAIGATLSLPANILNFLWLGWSGSQFQVQIPHDDLQAMAFLRRNSRSDAVVLQFPEPTKVSMHGRDTWVPIFAGRAIPASYRSTTWQISAPIVARMKRFYEGDARVSPGSGVDWIYLSRSLHPASYDLLVARLERAPAWDARLVLPGASLFARTEPADEQRGEREQRVPS